MALTVVTLRLAIVVMPLNVGLSDNTTEPVPVDVLVPVPPFATASVPVIVREPEVVMGPPAKVNPVVPPETFTDVTEPVLLQVGVAPAPADVRT